MVILCEECDDLRSEGAVYVTEDGKPFSPDTKDGLQLWEQRTRVVRDTELLARSQDVVNQDGN